MMTMMCQSKLRQVKRCWVAWMFWEKECNAESFDEHYCYENFILRLIENNNEKKKIDDYFVVGNNEDFSSQRKRAKPSSILNLHGTTASESASFNYYSNRTYPLPKKKKKRKKLFYMKW